MILYLVDSQQRQEEEVNRRKKEWTNWIEFAFNRSVFQFHLLINNHIRIDSMAFLLLYCIIIASSHKHYHQSHYYYSNSYFVVFVLFLSSLWYHICTVVLSSCVWFANYCILYLCTSQSSQRITTKQIDIVNSYCEL